MLLPAEVANVASRSRSVRASARSIRASDVRGFGLLLKLAKRNAAAWMAARVACNAGSTVVGSQPRSQINNVSGSESSAARAIFAADCNRSKVVASATGHTAMSKVAAPGPTRN